ncbi:MAG: YheU family protein [Gammaproteobacteria bacterium]|nr:YheU family protein [Gammaproteobacteria bacterium]
MEIPYTDLEKTTLNGLIEEFVSREGTDYGSHIYSLEDKVSHVMKQLGKGVVFIDYDAESSSCNIVKREP